MLMKKILLLASAILFSAMSFATDITITSADVVKKDGITISFAKADGAYLGCFYCVKHIRSTLGNS